MSEQSKTPRTEEALVDNATFSDWVTVSSPYARQLETELAEANTEILMLSSLVASGQMPQLQIAACFPICQNPSTKQWGRNQNEIQSMA